MDFIAVEGGIRVERDPLKISKLSEVQTKKGSLTHVEDTGDEPLTKDNFILFKTENNKKCSIKIDALRNHNVIIHIINFLLQKEAATSALPRRDCVVPVPEVNVLAQASKLKPEPTRKCRREAQKRLALIRVAAERMQGHKP